MRKIAVLWFFTCFFSGIAFADHITGGEMYYTFAGQSGGLDHYNFTMKLFMRCNSGRNFNNPTIISVFERSTGGRQLDLYVPLSLTETISITNPDPCISNPPEVCYEIGYYNFTVSVPANVQGYIVAGQVNYRIAGIANLQAGYSQIGATYSAEIPGTVNSSNDIINNSAQFVGSDLVIVCAKNAFSYSFEANDADDDKLSYSFCNAYRSSSQSSTGGNASPPQNPPFESVPYGSSFDGNAPLGNAVKIDAKTGLITGIAPAAGVYVVTVCVTETRNGKVIAVQRKDLQIAIASCELTAAKLQPEYMLCRDTKTISLSNLSTSSLVKSYDWEFRDRSGGLLYYSNSPTATYTFTDTGTYTVKLVINKSDRCSDSTTSLIRVYPGFIPDFDYAGVCINKPTIFTDKTTTVLGRVNSWNWAFDNLSIAAGAIEATTATTSHTYNSVGSKPGRLIVTNINGCRDTIIKQIDIVNKPPLLLSFKDTIICVNDQLQLTANGKGIYNWLPNSNIVNANTATPTVSPKSTTTYYVNLNDNGCLNNDSVKVRVTDHVDLTAMNDTTICATDIIELKIQSNGLKFLWDHSSQLNNPTLKSPLAATSILTDYMVTAYIGSCIATEHIIVKTVPYPIVDAGPDTSICFGTSVPLNGRSVSPNFKWSPSSGLSNTNILNPVAAPLVTTSYVLSAFEDLGCPKPGLDTVLVFVLPKIDAEAYTDTSVVIGEPIQFFASGGQRYEWSPPNGLSATNVASPNAIYSEPYDLLVYRILVYSNNCVDSAFLRVKVFATMPSVFVPTAFTPNGDGKNDLLKPIAAGIKTIEYFTVFNRYGQRVFHTTTNGQGWDGRINGEIQSTGAYIWMVRAIDFQGKPYTSKGTAVLIR